MRVAAAQTRMDSGRRPARLAEPRPARGLLILCAPSVLASGTWALWPLEPSLFGTLTVALADAGDPRAATPSPLNASAFRAPLWVMLPSPPPAPAPPPLAPAPPPLRLQLLAIVQHGDGFRAAVYDEVADRVVEVAVGDPVGGGTVRAVAAGSVDVLHNGVFRTLTLKAEEGSPAEGGQR